jgi:predicted DNA-binding protein
VTRRKPPSRVRYEKTHPVVSARLGMDDYKRLREILETEGKSFAQFLREIINKAKVKYSKAYQLGYNIGKGEWQIWYHCSICGERINVTPNGESHKALMEYLEGEGWGHASCHEERRRRRGYRY